MACIFLVLIKTASSQESKQHSQQLQGFAVEKVSVLVRLDASIGLCKQPVKCHAIQVYNCVSADKIILNSVHMMHVSVPDCLCFVLQTMLQLCMRQSLSFTSGNDCSFEQLIDNNNKFGQPWYVQSIP